MYFQVARRRIFFQNFQVPDLEPNSLEENQQFSMLHLCTRCGPLSSHNQLAIGSVFEHVWKIKFAYTQIASYLGPQKIC